MEKDEFEKLIKSIEESKFYWGQLSDLRFAILKRIMGGKKKEK